MNKMNEFKSDFKRILSNGLYWKSSESVLTLIKQAYLLYSFGISSHLDGFYLGMSIVSLSIYALGESFDLYLVSRRGWSGSYRDIQLLMYLFLVALLSLALGYLLIDSEIIVFKPYVHLLPSFILIACSYFPYRYLLTYLKLQKKINQAYSVEFLFSATVLLYIVCIDNSFNGLFDSIFFALATSIILALIMIEKSPIQLGENLSMSGFWKFHIGHIFDFLSDLLEKSLLGMIGVGVISIYSYMQYAVLFCKKVVVGNGLYVHLLNEDGYDVGLKNRLAYLFKLFLLSNIFVCVMIFLVHEVARFSEIRINFHDELIFLAALLFLLCS